MQPFENSTVHLIVCIFRSDITSCSYGYCQHLSVQNNVSEQLVGGDTGPFLTAFVFFLIAHIHANITYAPAGTICICWPIWIGVLAVSYQLLGIIQTSTTIAQDIQQKAVMLTVTQRLNECLPRKGTYIRLCFPKEDLASERLWGRVIFWVIFKL